MDPLFDASFLKKLELLTLSARRTFAGRSRGEQRSTRHGSSVEFADYRQYTPGDDFRRIDWNAYARFDNLFLKLFREEFALTDRFSSGRSRGRGRRRGRRVGAPTPSGPKVKGRIKKLVRDRGFGFVRGDDGKEVFFHRSGLGSTDYDALSEGDVVEYVVQEGPRGARAENVRAVSEG